MGDPRDEKTFIGPMIDEAAARRVESWIEAARRGGAKVLAGGERKGSLLPGHDADLLLIDGRMHVQAVFVGGQKTVENGKVLS